jgi:hypothetical protein
MPEDDYIEASYQNNLVMAIHHSEDGQIPIQAVLPDRGMEAVATGLVKEEDGFYKLTDAGAALARKTPEE